MRLQYQRPEAAMVDVVICEPVRTPVGRFGGVFSGLSAADLATSALTSLLARTSLAEGDVDDVVLGQCYPNGEAPAIGRIAALDAGLGTSVPSPASSAAIRPIAGASPLG